MPRTITVDFDLRSTINFVAHGQKYVTAFANATHAEAESILEWSKAEWVPVQTGFLQSTGYIQPVDYGDSGTYHVEIGYSALYARVVHDAPPDWGQGKARYLEWPLLLSKAGYIDRIIARMNGEIGSGVTRANVQTGTATLGHSSVDGSWDQGVPL